MKDRGDCGNPNCPTHGSGKEFEELQIIIANVSQAIVALSVIRDLDPADLGQASGDAILGLCKHFRDNELLKMPVLKEKIDRSKKGKVCLSTYEAKTPNHKSGLYYRVKVSLYIEQGVPEGELLQ